MILEQTGYQKLGNMTDIRVHGTAPATGMLMTTRTIDVATEGRRHLTPDRKRIADYLMAPEPVRSLLVAHKVISEWLEHDNRKHKPSVRIETQQHLEAEIRRHGARPGPAGQFGRWFTSQTPSSEAPDIERTIEQALRAFAQMVGTKTIYVFGREN